MNNYTNIVASILKEQKSIMGPVAIELANGIDGLKAKSVTNISIEGDPKKVIKKLVEEYRELFGHASVEVCRDAVRAIRPPVPVSELPDILR